VLPIFVCDDTSNEMRTISFIWNDYSAFTIVTVIWTDMTFKQMIML